MLVLGYEFDALLCTYRRSFTSPNMRYARIGAWLEARFTRVLALGYESDSVLFTVLIRVMSVRSPGYNSNFTLRAYQHVVTCPIPNFTRTVVHDVGLLGCEISFSRVL